MKDFACLGSSINFVINNTIDAKSRVWKANDAIDVLKFVQDVTEFPLEAKIKVHQVITMNLVLKGSKNYSSNKAAQDSSYQHRQGGSQIKRLDIDLEVLS